MACTPFSCEIVTDVPQSECNALVSLYNDTNGINWTSQANRLGSGDWTKNTVCDRDGISCTQGDDGFQHVYYLNLGNKNLS